MNTYHTGLVLEGGGMRSSFTAGVLDALLDYGADFPYVIGTSAGATSGINFISRQRGRTKFSNVDLHAIRQFVGLKSFLNGRGVIDMEFLFEEMPRTLYPFDSDAFFASGVRFVAVATSALSGKAVYMEEYENFQRLVDMCRASCSLPVMCPMWSVDGVPMVDGGVADSIPFERALNDGCQRVVVVMTKDASYSKPDKPMWLPAPIYRKFPNLREALVARNMEYNAQARRLAALESEGRAIVVRPPHLCGVGRTTTDIEALEELYALGLVEGRKLAFKLGCF